MWTWLFVFTDSYDSFVPHFTSYSRDISTLTFKQTPLFLHYTLHTLRHSTFIKRISRQSKEITIRSILFFIFSLHFLQDSQHSNRSIWIDIQCPSYPPHYEVLSQTASVSKVDKQESRVSVDKVISSDHPLSHNNLSTLSPNLVLFTWTVSSQVPQVCESPVLQYSTADVIHRDLDMVHPTPS